MIKINKKKILYVILGVILIIFLVIISRNIEVEKVDNIEEISSEAEISEEDEKQINFVGYVLNTDNSTIERKLFIINQDEVVTDMYKNILNTVVQKNNEENLKTVNEIFEVSINRCEEDKGTLSIYLDNDILEFEKLSALDRENFIKMINRTMLEINEITNVKYFFYDKEYVAENV